MALNGVAPEVQNATVRSQLPRLGWQRLQFPREVVETALARAIGDKAEQAQTSACSIYAYLYY
jgi:hypothetical protein